MSCCNKKETLVFRDLTEIFEPKSAFSDIGALDKWRVTPFETSAYKGKIISAIGKANPPDITFDPKVKGWYKIVIEMPCQPGWIFIKLSSEEAFHIVSAQSKSLFVTEHFLWRCADLTNEKIIITRSKERLGSASFISGITLIPMTDEEVEEWKREDARTDTKSIYATDDMHNRPYHMNMDTVDDWVSTVLPFAHSDTEWFSIEELRVFAEGKCPTEPDDFAFIREGDRNVQAQFSKIDYDEVLRRVVEKTKEFGIKSSVSIRMGAWGMCFPYDQCYFDCDFIDEHPEWCCHDRNGEIISSLSYAYPEVRRFFIDKIINMARSGCEAVTLIAHRAPPFVLFEKPVADRFYDMYGEYPYELPFDDKRLNGLWCEIMTNFFRELRAELDRVYGKNKVEIHLRGLFSLYANKYFGLDCEKLADEGLINALVSYPWISSERYFESVFTDETHTRIDLDKYTEIALSNTNPLSMTCDFDFRQSFPDSKGEIQGPKTQEERIKEWCDFEDKYGVKVYIDILPRHMQNGEFKRRALELYDLGAKRLSLWDTYQRAWWLPMWDNVRKFGHKDELRDMPDHGPEYSIHRVIKLGTKSVYKFNPMWGG